MAGLDLLLEALRDVPHEGYRDGEVARYGDCPDGCHEIVRTDRTDLLSEHRRVCPAARPCDDCGAAIALVLALLGSNRCHDCRDA